MEMLIVKLLNALSIVLCNAGLFYQIYILGKDYFEGLTVVNLRIGRIYNETLPAITVCYPELLSFKKVASLNEDWQNHFDAYVKVVDKINHGEINLTITEINQIISKYDDIYIRIVGELLEGTSIADLTLLDQYSLKMIEADWSKNIFSRHKKNAIIYGDMFNANLTELGMKNYMGFIFYHMDQPMDSVWFRFKDREDRYC